MSLAHILPDAAAPTETTSHSHRIAMPKTPALSREDRTPARFRRFSLLNVHSVGNGQVATEEGGENVEKPTTQQPEVSEPAEDLPTPEDIILEVVEVLGRFDGRTPAPQSPPAYSPGVRDRAD